MVQFSLLVEIMLYFEFIKEGKLGIGDFNDRTLPTLISNLNQTKSIYIGTGNVFSIVSTRYDECMESHFMMQVFVLEMEHVMD